jgi:hypothetical protein
MEKSCRRYGTTAPKSKQPRHLLSGIARCAECGGPIRVESSKLGNRTVKVYACSYNRTRGKVVCGNGLRRPIEEVNGAVLDWIRRNILTEEVVIEVIRALRRRLEQRARTAGPDLSKLESQAAKLRKEIANGVDSLVKMGHSPAVAAAVAEREADLQRIEGRIEAAKAAPARSIWRRAVSNPKPAIAW